MNRSCDPFVLIAEWTEDAFNRFEELTACAKWKVMIAKFERFVNGKPSLRLIDTSGKEVRSFVSFCYFWFLIKNSFKYFDTSVLAFWLLYHTELAKILIFVIS